MKPDVESLLHVTADLPPEQREAFLARECPDAALRREVVAMLQYAEDAESFFDNAIVGAAVSLSRRQEPSPGDRIGSYRITSLIGRGGMGSVYMAQRVDGEIQQRVAIKLLRADGNRQEWRERFLRERQLLATLQHPSVVHVIDAGHTDDGRPFLVMEYVDGVPIDRYSAGIPIRERLKLFLLLCEGVLHAHQRLIIHRDLKPSNILVDGTGHPKVLDFGIAKLQGETGDVTQTVDQLLSPNYASPEQLRGDPQTTATDIYSLGAVLYKMLTGTEVREMTRRIANGESTPVIRLNTELPRDMDYVIGKALRAEAEHRYRSVDEFATDVRAVLERRPVQARAGDTWYRTRRYLRRYWIPVTAAALVMASLAGGLIATDRQRRIAERRFADVRQLANKLFDIDLQVAQLPGGSKTRQLIVNTALEYLQRITVNVAMQPELALDMGTAYMRVARVQGVNISANLGQTVEADASAKKAQDLVDSVLAVQPANRMALLRAAQIAHDRMTLAGDGRHEEQALQFAHAALGRLDQYFRAGTLNAASDRQEAQQVIITLINVANRFVKANEFDEAIRIGERAIEVAHATNWPSQAGAALIIVSMAHREQGDLEAALLAIRESVRILTPSNGETAAGRLQTYGLALIREGQILGEPQSISLNRPTEAIESYQHALEIGQDFARRDAADFQSQYRIFSAETKIADLLRESEPARALALYDDALRRMAGAAANAGTLRNETMTLAASTYPLLHLGRRADARGRLDGALQRLARVKQYPASEIELGSPAASTLRALAEYEADGGNSKCAAAIYEELIRLVHASTPKHETVLQDAVALSNIYAAAAPFYREAGKIDGAADVESRRLEIWRQWAVKRPATPFVEHQLEAARVAQLARR